MFDGNLQLPSGAKRALLLGLAVVGLVVMASSDFVHAWLIDWLTWAGRMMQARPVMGKILFVIAAGASAMVAFVSSAVVVPVAVLAWGRATSFVLLWLGWMLGGAGAYALSRFLGRRVVLWTISESSFAAYEKMVPRDAPFGLILLFQTALPSEVPGYLLGLARYPFRKYIAALAISELPYALATIYLGESFLERRMFLLIGTGIAMAAFSGWTVHWLRGRMQADR